MLLSNAISRLNDALRFLKLGNPLRRGANVFDYVVKLANRTPLALLK
jgi:hypothetical protein